MESSDTQSRRHSVVAQPQETELVTSREHDNGRCANCDIREGKSEFNGRMHGLTGLQPRRQIGASND